MGMEPTFLMASNYPVLVGQDVSAGPGILITWTYGRKKVIPAVAIHAFVRDLQADYRIKQLPEERCRQTPVWRH